MIRNRNGPPGHDTRRAASNVVRVPSEGADSFKVAACADGLRDVAVADLERMRTDGQYERGRP